MTAAVGAVVTHLNLRTKTGNVEYTHYWLMSTSSLLPTKYCEGTHFQHKMDIVYGATCISFLINPFWFCFLLRYLKPRVY